ncbi:TonB-dependent receptor plug domain-containing protein [Massilia sp. H-1]|nr:TonB-dependent receptor plug domain-containing protein [Massilia sp. H-1]
MLCLSAHAQAAEQELGTIQITAQSGVNTNTVVGAARIEVEQAVSLQDLFKQTPEVSVGGGGLPVAQKLYVRGIGERMLAVTIDGAAQPESAYHHTGQVMVEPELLKRVEVEAEHRRRHRRAGRWLGALRFTTKSANELLRPGERIGARLQAATLAPATAKNSGSACLAA